MLTTSNSSIGNLVIGGLHAPFFLLSKRLLEEGYLLDLVLTIMKGRRNHLEQRGRRSRSMNYDFMDNFVPQLTNASDRPERFWVHFQYTIVREETLGHTLGLVRSGEGFLELNGKRHKLRSGVLFYVPKGSYMKMTTQPTNTLEFYSSQFQYNHMHWESASDSWIVAEKGPIPLQTTMFFTENGALLDAYRRLLHLWKGKDAGYLWHCKLELLQLLNLVIRMTRESSKHIQQNAVLVESAIAFIRDHLRDDLNRATLARHLSVSPGHFAGMFKRHTGYSLSEYVHRLRMDQARFLLRSTHIPIHQIAAEIGYDDSFYFSRRFSKENGMSPRDYRKT
ncbi:MAG: transcriptional regulator [Paenibacillus sp.]|jgi:AraC-like DNA-binding protein|nr:transcriptional regulator [Paenibacillus sp.]